MLRHHARISDVNSEVLIILMFCAETNIYMTVQVIHVQFGLLVMTIDKYCAA